MPFKKTRVRRRRPVHQKTVKVQGVLENVLSQRGWTEKLHEMQIIEAWSSIVGTHAAAQSVPVSLSHGILKVAVAHPSCSTELSSMKTDILIKLQKTIETINKRDRRPDKGPKVRDIRFHLNPHISKVRILSNPSSSETEEDKPVSQPVPDEMNERIEATVSVVQDDELRDALKTLFQTQCSYKQASR